MAFAFFAISGEQLSLNVAGDSAKTLSVLGNKGVVVLNDCGLRFVQKCRRPPQNTPDFGGPISKKKSRACSPTEIIPNRWTKEPNFAVACLIHVLTQRPRESALKTRRGLVILIFTRRRVSAYFFFRTLVKNEITSPLRVFSARFWGRWVSRCMRHATAKFGSF